MADELITDIFVAGGGIAGMIATAAFAHAGFDTICVDPAPAPGEMSSAPVDLRTTAFLQPARRLFERIGIWDKLAPHATSLEVMRIVDAGGADLEPRASHDFTAEEISDEPFGWNLPNRIILQELRAHLASLPQVRVLSGVGAQSLLTRDSEAIIRLSDGRKARSKLVVAADGRNSTIRASLDIPVKTSSYGQHALVFTVNHNAPHRNVSTEIHRTGGPFTFVPLPDLNGRPASAIVWMEKSARVHELISMPVPEFDREITARSAGLFGKLELASARSKWPIISQIAERLHAERSVLIAEAAHVVPPIGAQGLNMSMGDLSCLLDILERNPSDPGAAAGLAEYARRRVPEVKARVAAVDALNRASIAEFQAIRDLRLKGLNMLHAVSPIRRTLMRLGLGATLR